MSNKLPLPLDVKQMTPSTRCQTNDPLNVKQMTTSTQCQTNDPLNVKQMTLLH